MAIVLLFVLLFDRDEKMGDKRAAEILVLPPFDCMIPFINLIDVEFQEQYIRNIECIVQEQQRRFQLD